MMWVISKRQVVYELVKKRRVRSANRKKVGNVYHGSNMDDYIRRTHGIDRTIFETSLFMDEFRCHWFNNWFKYLYVKFRPVYYELFHDDLKEFIKICIDEGYIEENSHNGKKYLKDTPKGRKFISPFYYPLLIFEHKLFGDFPGKILKLLILLFLGYTGLSTIFGTLLR